MTVSLQVYTLILHSHKMFRCRNYFRKSFISNSSTTYNHLLRFSSAAITTTKQHKPTHFMIDYLKSSLGFSTEEATSASTKLTRVKSTENPTSVLNFFKESGFNETQIRYLISSSPKLLNYSVEKTLKPKLKVFQDLGVSDSVLFDFIIGDSCLFTRGLDTHIVPSIGFLEKYLGSKENVVKAIKKSKWLISCNVNKRMQPNILFLQKYGISDENIKKLVLRYPGSLLSNPIWLEKVVGRVERELGISCESKMFTYAISAVGGLSKLKWESKYQIFKSFGWSKVDVVTLVRSLPICMNNSEEKIRRGLNFLMGELGYTPEYIVHHPCLLTYSLEKRIVPRHTVLKVLKERNLIKTDVRLYTLLCKKEIQFQKEFLLHYKDEAPDVYEAYIKSINASKTT